MQTLNVNYILEMYGVLYMTRISMWWNGGENFRLHFVFFTFNWVHTKLHMGFVKEISVLNNFLLQNTNVVPVPNYFAGEVWQDWRISRPLF